MAIDRREFMASVAAITGAAQAFGSIELKKNQLFVLKLDRLRDFDDAVQIKRVWIELFAPEVAPKLLIIGPELELTVADIEE